MGGAGNGLPQGRGAASSPEPLSIVRSADSRRLRNALKCFRVEVGV